MRGKYFVTYGETNELSRLESVTKKQKIYNRNHLFFIVSFYERKLFDKNLEQKVQAVAALFPLSPLLVSIIWDVTHERAKFILEGLTHAGKLIRRGDRYFGLQVKTPVVAVTKKRGRKRKQKKQKQEVAA